jgi:hypothetical protein
MAHLPLYRQSRRGHGALLIALLLAVVIGIFLLYGNMGGGSYMQQVGTTRQQGKQLAQDLNTRQLSMLIAQYRSENGKLPRTAAEMEQDAAFKDPWGNPLLFTFEEPRMGATQVTYRSAGPDGEHNTEDDIVKTEPLPF